MKTLIRFRQAAGFEVLMEPSFLMGSFPVISLAVSFSIYKIETLFVSGRKHLLEFVHETLYFNNISRTDLPTISIIHLVRTQNSPKN